jgi:hypothetical protein
MVTTPLFCAQVAACVEAFKFIGGGLVKVTCAVSLQFLLSVTINV